MTPDEEQRAIGDVIDRVAGRLPGFPRDTIQATVEQHHGEFEGPRSATMCRSSSNAPTIRALAIQAPAVAPAAVLDLPDGPAQPSDDEPTNDESTASETLKTDEHPPA